MPVRSLLTRGSGAILIDIECHLSNNLPNIVIVGLANRSVTEARERIRGAFASSRIRLPRKRVIINLAPADVPKSDSSLDLAIAVAILSAGGQLLSPLDDHTAIVGELGLDGTVRPVRGIIGKLLTARACGLTTFVIPAANIKQAQLIPGITLIPVSSFNQLYCHLSGLELIAHIQTTTDTESMSHNVAGGVGTMLSEVTGQAQAKRALEIAAAGGHNVLLSGPPGTGKSMLAQAIPSILPPLTREEMLEVTHIHSLASRRYDRLITRRPFRAPHHSASLSALCGGGATLKPGEITLAHYGVLYLDELPEFNRGTIEALRQPLENRTISVARNHDTAEYPASFMLVATANPCPCGYYGVEQIGHSCICKEWQVLDYQRRLSGPILDRIDLHIGVHEVDHEQLLANTDQSDHAIRARVASARQLQANRYQEAGKLNSSMTNAEVQQFAQLEPAAASLLNTAATALHLSARSYFRTIKIARTIADLEQKTNIDIEQVTEALNYRRRAMLQ